MGEVEARAAAPAAEDLDVMHDLYRQAGLARQIAPHIVYDEPTCPHPGCSLSMHALDFRLKDHGRAIHDPLVRAWWNDTGFAGQCPRCVGWVHFTIRAKTAIADEEAERYPHLPVDWHAKATIL